MKNMLATDMIPTESQLCMTGGTINTGKAIQQIFYYSDFIGHSLDAPEYISAGSSISITLYKNKVAQPRVIIRGY